MKIMDELDSSTPIELDILWENNHENIVRYFDHFHLKIGVDDKTFLITEFCEVITNLFLSELTFILHRYN